MFVVSTLELLLIAVDSFRVLNCFVFLFSFSPLWANREEAVYPPRNGRWRQDICSWHIFTFYDNIYNKPNISSLLPVDTYPPFLPWFLPVCVSRLQFVVWFCSALSEKLARAKYSKFYLAPEITWYWLAPSFRHQAGLSSFLMLIYVKKHGVECRHQICY